MLQQLFKLLRVGFLPLFFVISGCGGSDDTPEAVFEAPNIALSSLDVSGFDINFDPDKNGPYEIQVGNAVTTLTVTPTTNRDGLVLDTYQSTTLAASDSESTLAIETGVAHQYDLAEGTNVIVIRVRDEALLLATNYTLIVNRVSASASLVNFVLGSDLNETGAYNALAFDQTFDPSLYTYTATVPYENCTVFVSPYTNNASTRLNLTTPLRTITDAISSSPSFFDLQLGENLVSASLTSEDGSSTVDYSLTITRSGTVEEQEADANLASLSLNPAELTFLCENYSYSPVYVNNNVTSIQLVAQASYAGASITVNDESYVSGEALEITLDEALTILEVVVSSADGTNENTYSFAVVKRDRNVVNVSTAAELQTALLNAQANDEIRVAGGEYLGVASLAESGSDNAHFYSAQSGTADEPIFLTANSIYADSVLLGDDLGQHAVLMISGGFWEIVGLEFEGANNGIVLDAASDNVIRSVEVNDVGGQGIVLRNGSSRNVITDTRVSNTGADETNVGYSEGVVIGSDDALWASEPGGNGIYNEGDNDNIIRSSLFTSSIRSEAIEINEGALNTLVELNTLESGSLSAQAGDVSLINIQGNDAIVRYNTFRHSSDTNLDSLIAVNDASESWHAIDWGENAQIYQNYADLNGVDVPFVNANMASVVSVAENRRVDGGDVIYQGAGIDQSGLSVPLYQIQLAADDNLCLRSEALSETVPAHIVKIQSCVDNDLSMQWKLLADADGYLTIVNAEDETQLMYPANTFTSGCSQTNLTQSMVRVDDKGTEGMIYYWRLAFDGDDVYFANKSNERFLLTAMVDSEGVYQTGNPMLMCTGNGGETQRYRLVAQ